MVRKIFTLIICFISLQAVGQNAYLDEIQLMDYFRNRQLIGNTTDSLLVKQQSFMIRSTFTFQNLFYTSSPKDKGLRIKSFLFSDNRLINNFLPISSNDGNLIPAYEVNRLLSNIPILGQILTGKSGDGVFGVSFKIKGKDNNFETTINPIRTLTPRFVQRFIEIFKSAK